MLGNVGYRNFPTAFSPAALFAAAEPGVWYDPSDVANTLWLYNLYTWTEQFDNAFWSKNAVTISANATTAPDGTMTADKIQETAVTNFFAVVTNPTALPSTTYTWSCYAKAAERNFLALNFSVSGCAGTWNLTTGANNITGGTATATSLDNGWWRLSVRFTTPASGSNLLYNIFGPSNTNSIATYAGVAGNGIFMWGAQLQLGSTATTYQPITTVNAGTLARFPFATLYQDSAGTTLVNAPNQPVGLMLDKSQGSPVGPEIVVNGTFDAGVSGWTAGGATIAVEGQKLKITNTGASFGYAYQSFTTVVGRTYLISANINVGTAGTVYLRAGISALSFSYFNASTSVDTVLSGTFVATATTSFVHILNTNVTDGFSIVDNISVKLVTGSQATQSTAGSRPTYGIVPATGRRNLLVQTEDFSNVAWEKNGTTISTNTNVAPDGTITADTATATTIDPGLTQIISGTGLTYTFSIWLRGVGSSIGKMPTLFLIRDAFAQVLLSGTLPVLTGNWQRYTFTGTFSVAPTSQVRARVDYVDTSPVIGDAVNVWGAQLETGSTATAYQRVVTTFEVTEANVASLSYLSFDGIDDFMVTPTITPGTDKVQAFAGFRKLTETQGLLVEINQNAAAFNGSFGIQAPGASPNSFRVVSRGDVGAGFAGTASNIFPSPITNVITGIGSISEDLAILRVNGSQISVGPEDQGAGNYLPNIVYIGRRAGAALPLNGNLFGLLMRFGSNLTTTAISRTESWMNSKTGAY